MSSSLNELREFGQRWMDALFNDRNMDAIDELYAQDYKRNDGLAEVDLDSFKEHNRCFFEAFPDLTYTPVHIVADGDLVVVRWNAEGTFKEDLKMGEMVFTATMLPFALRGTDTLRIVDGKIVESWSSLDMAALLAQIDPPIGQRFGEILAKVFN